MSTQVAGLGLTDGFLTVVTKHPDGIYLNSIGLDPRGEAALNEENTGGGPGRDSDGDEPGEPIIIVIAPNPINVPPSDDPIQLIPIGLDNAGRYVPVEPDWTRDPEPEPGERRLEEVATGGSEVYEYFTTTAWPAWGASLSFDHTFKADERTVIIIGLETLHFASTEVAVVVDLSAGSILLSQTSGAEWLIFDDAAAIQDMGDGYYRITFSITQDPAEISQGQYEAASGQPLYVGCVLDDGTFSPRVGTTGFGVIIDSTFLSTGTPVATNTQITEGTPPDASTVDPDTGLLTIGSIEETFDVIATVGAVEGSVTVTVAAP